MMLPFYCEIKSFNTLWHVQVISKTTIDWWYSFVFVQVHTKCACCHRFIGSLNMHFFPLLITTMTNICLHFSRELIKIAAALECTWNVINNFEMNDKNWKQRTTERQCGKKRWASKEKRRFFYLLFWMGLSICNGNENNDYKIELKLNKQMHLSQCK